MTGLLLLIFLLLGLVGLLFAVVGLVKRDKHYPVNESAGFWLTIIFGIVVLAFGIGFFTRNFKIIDAGEVGVQVRFGRVLEQTLSQGFNTKSPFVDVYVYNIRLKEYTMSVAVGEGEKEAPDEVRARTKDNSNISLDATVWWAIDPDSAFDIYRKVSKNEAGLKDMIIRPAVRASMRDVAALFTLDELMKNREIFGDKVTEYLVVAVVGKGIYVDRVLIRSIEPPEMVDASIQEKLRAEQELQRKEFELLKAEKDAEIREVTAVGIANAQEIIQEKLTPLYVQYEAIQAYRELAGSPNTTFVILPTSTEGVGLPLIIDARGMSPSVQAAGK